MAFEARIAAGLGVPVVCGGDGQNLAASLARAMAAGCGGLISFGVAGGLAPDLKPGTCVIGSAILDDEAAAADRRALGAAADAHHSRRRSTARSPACASRSRMPSDKRALHQRDRRDRGRHGIARRRARGRAARRAGRGDPRGGRSGRAHHSALGAGRHAAPTARSIRSRVMRSLMRYPRDLAGLIRMSLDARAARATLVRGSGLLGPGLGLLDTAPVPATASRSALEGDLGAGRTPDSAINGRRRNEKCPARGRAFSRWNWSRRAYSAAVR